MTFESKYARKKRLQREAEMGGWDETPQPRASSIRYVRETTYGPISPVSLPIRPLMTQVQVDLPPIEVLDIEIQKRNNRGLFGRRKEKKYDRDE